MLSQTRVKECRLPPSLPWFYKQDACHAACDALGEPGAWLALAADKPKDREPDKIVKTFSYIRGVDALVQLLLENGAGPQFLTLYEQVREGAACRIFGDMEYELDIDAADFERARAEAVEVARGAIDALGARIAGTFGIAPAFVVLEGTRMISPARVKCSFHVIAQNVALSAAHEEQGGRSVMRSLFVTEPFTPDSKGWDTGVYTPNRMLRLPMCVKWGSTTPLRLHRGLTSPALRALDDAALIRAAVLTHVADVPVFDTAVIRARMPQAAADNTTRKRARDEPGAAGSAPKRPRSSSSSPLLERFRPDLEGMRAAVVRLVRDCGDATSKVQPCKQASDNGKLMFYVQNVKTRVCIQDASGQTRHKNNNGLVFLHPVDDDVHVVEFACSAPQCEAKAKRRKARVPFEPEIGVLRRQAPGSREFRHIRGRDAVQQARAGALAEAAPAGGGDGGGDDADMMSEAGDDDDHGDGDDEDDGEYTEAERGGGDEHDKHDDGGGGTGPGDPGDPGDDEDDDDDGGTWDWERVEAAVRAAVGAMHQYDSKNIRSYNGRVLPALAALARGCPAREAAFRHIFVDYHTRTAPTFYIAAPSQAKLWKDALAAAAAAPAAAAPDASHVDVVGQLEAQSMEEAARAAAKYAAGIMNPDHLAWAEAKLRELGMLYPSKAAEFDLMSVALPCRTVTIFDAEQREFMRHAHMREDAAPLDALQELYRVNASYHAKLDEFKANRSFSREPAVHIEVTHDALLLKTPKQMMAKYSDVLYFEKQGVRLVSRPFIDKYVKDPRKNIFERMDMTPGKHPAGGEWDVLNTWHGWLGEEYDVMPQEQAEAVSKLWFDHIREVWACDNMDVYRYIIIIFAMMVQRPWQRGHVAPVLMGLEGCGKDLPLDIFRNHVLGPKHTNFVDRAGQQLFDRFGNAAANKVLVHVTEADDMFKYEGRLKSMITADTISYEEKNKDTVMMRNCSTFFFTTNKTNSFVITQGERRLLLLETSARYKNNKEYFNNFRRVLDNAEGGAAIFQALMRVDLSAIGPTDTLQFMRPTTEAHQAQQERRVPCHALFLSSLATHFFTAAVGDGKFEAMGKDDIFEVECGKFHALGAGCSGAAGGKPIYPNGFACDVRTVIGSFEIMRHGGKRVYILSQRTIANALIGKSMYVERADFVPADQCVVVRSDDEAEQMRAQHPDRFQLRFLCEDEVKKMRLKKPDHPVFPRQGAGAP